MVGPTPVRAAVHALVEPVGTACIDDLGVARGRSQRPDRTSIRAEGGPRAGHGGLQGRRRGEDEQTNQQRAQEGRRHGGSPSRDATIAYRSTSREGAVGKAGRSLNRVRSFGVYGSKEN